MKNPISYIGGHPRKLKEDLTEDEAHTILAILGREIQELESRAGYRSGFRPYARQRVERLKSIITKMGFEVE